MQLYLFALDDDVPCPESGERLSDDDAARNWALQISREVNRNRRSQEDHVRIRVFRADGSPLTAEANA